MKRSGYALLLTLCSLGATAQEHWFSYTGRNTPSVKREELAWINAVEQLTPHFWTRLELSRQDWMELDRRRTRAYGSVASAKGGKTPVQAFAEIISVEVTGCSRGQVLSSIGEGSLLNAAQKGVLFSADAGSEVLLCIKFRYNEIGGDTSGTRRVVEGKLPIAVIPATEAAFPGGNSALTAYLVNSVFSKISTRDEVEKVMRVTVKFTVNTDGRALQPAMSRSTGDARLDKLLLEAVRNMPLWTPAETSWGIRISQEISIPFGGGC